MQHILLLDATGSMRQGCCMMQISDLIEVLGGDVIVAKHVGCKPATVRSWRHRDSLPLTAFPQIVALAKKKRVPGVTLESLHIMKAKA